MLDMMLCVAALLFTSAVLYGFRVILLWLSSVLTAVLCEAAFQRLRKKPNTIADGSAMVTGSLLALLCPAGAPYYLPMLGSAFAILAIKMPAGGLGRYPVNPTAAGWCFMAACMPGDMFAYPAIFPRKALSLAVHPSFRPAASSALLIKEEALAGRGPMDILCGKLVGPLGATMAVVLAACACYLIYRRTASHHIMAGFVFACGVLAAFFPRAGLSGLDSILWELCSGSLLFCAIFVATEPVTSPFLRISQTGYGLLCGVLTMVFRRMPGMEQGAPIAILLCSLLSPLLDRLFLPRGRRNKIPNREPLALSE